MYHAFKQAGPATHLVGMNNLSLLKSNLDVYLNGISEKESKVMEEIKEKYLNDKFFISDFLSNKFPCF